MSRRVGRLVAAFVLAVLPPLAGVRAPAGAQSGPPAGYTVIDLGVLDGDTAGYATAVNAAGVAVGTSTNAATGAGRAVIYRDGELAALALPGSMVGGSAADLNAGGIVVGSASGEDGTPRPVRWTADGAPSALATLGGDLGVAEGVNDRGQVVGWSWTTEGKQHATLWDGDTPADLGTVGEGDYSGASDVNEEGVVAGYATTAFIAPEGAVGIPYNAVVWANGTATLLPALGGLESYALGINDAGVVVGVSTTGDGQFAYGDGSHAAIWTDGTASDLGALPGGDRSAATGINGAGFVVGYSAVAPGDPTYALGENRACLWVDGAIRDLNDLIPDDSGWILDAAYGINDDGLIVGAGVLNGEGRAFLLVPTEA